MLFAAQSHIVPFSNRDARFVVLMCKTSIQNPYQEIIRKLSRNSQEIAFWAVDFGNVIFHRTVAEDTELFNQPLSPYSPRQHPNFLPGLGRTADGAQI
jgi:hypothetical protein